MNHRYPSIQKHILSSILRCLYVLLLTAWLLRLETTRLWAAPNVPATYFGAVLSDPSVPDFVPAVGMTVRAEINGKSCGQSTTFSENSQIVYRILVEEDSDIGGIPGCGVEGAIVTFFITEQLMQPIMSWSDGIIQEIPLRPALPPTSTPTSTVTPKSTLTPTATPASSPITVPEPITIILFSMGLAGLGARISLHKRKS